MIDLKQFSTLVIGPTLDKLGLNSLAARRLIAGTIYSESHFMYLKQIKGPALGLIQMEPATHKDLWITTLAARPDLKSVVLKMANADMMDKDGHPLATTLITDLDYAVAMCRIFYLRIKAPLPQADDAAGLAKYHEVFYNTVYGAVGRTPDVLENLNLFKEVIRSVM